MLSGLLQLDRLLEFLTSSQFIVGLLWGGLGVFTVCVLVLMRTRWGQYRPLRKCLALSLLVHILLVGYTTTVEIIATQPAAEEPSVKVTWVEPSTAERSQRKSHEPEAPQQQPWEALPHDTAPEPEPPQTEREQPEPLPEPDRQPQAEPADLPGDPSLVPAKLPDTPLPEPKAPVVEGPRQRPAPSKTAQAIEAPSAQRREAVRVTMPLQAAPRQPARPSEEAVAISRRPSSGVPAALLQEQVPLPRLASPLTPEPAEALAALTDRLSPVGRFEPTSARRPSRDYAPLDMVAGPEAPSGMADRDMAGAGASSTGPSEETTAEVARGSTANQSEPSPAAAPEIYRLRTVPDRLEQAQRQGATPQTEAAVNAALKWLAANQQSDGRWDASLHGGGRELEVLGRSRDSAGIRADTGVTGLALLAYLGAGHTHLKGPYRENVRRGLVYLMSMQAKDGNIGGHATGYARMYCHAMATFAMSEAYAMTRDERLEPWVRRAIEFSVVAQDPKEGGYRYRPGEAGDTSQIGWQLMALKSAALAGIEMPLSTRNGIIRYLRSASSGKHGGLASYRPNERVTRPMTAEAMVCWQFLGIPREHPACDEAGDYLSSELPGEGEKNLYYWYYGTLAMYQLQGDYWERWDRALKDTLLPDQRRDGPLAGSWDPNSVWGGYGGRVYSTAMAALSLEVYYRFLPLYKQTVPEVARRE